METDATSAVLIRLRDLIKAVPAIDGRCAIGASDTTNPPKLITANIILMNAVIDTVRGEDEDDDDFGGASVVAKIDRYDTRIRVEYLVDGSDQLKILETRAQVQEAIMADGLWSDVVEYIVRVGMELVPGKEGAKRYLLLADDLQVGYSTPSGQPRRLIL